MKLIFLFAANIITLKTMCQLTIPGQYIFHQREMVAGFKFFETGRFDFFFSYGAVDRSATGTFSKEGKTIRLKSDKEAGKDFTVMNKSLHGEGYTVTVESENSYLLSNIRCSFFVAGERHDEYSNEKGVIKVPYPHCDSIFIMHTLFPDFVTRIKDVENLNNNFTLSLNPSLAQVSFKGIDLTIEDDSTLSCVHNYLMPIEGIRFEKE